MNAVHSFVHAYLLAFVGGEASELVSVHVNRCRFVRIDPQVLPAVHVGAIGVCVDRADIQMHSHAIRDEHRIEGFILTRHCHGSQVTDDILFSSRYSRGVDIFSVGLRHFGPAGEGTVLTACRLAGIGGQRSSIVH